MSGKKLKSFAGQRGEKIRSDCYVEINITRSGGINLDVRSKVSAMYGNSIKVQLLKLSDFFNIKNADILIDDYGALPFTIAARFETAVRRIYPDLNKSFLPEKIKTITQNTSKERLRRSRLYLPGNEPKFFVNSGLHKPDGIILDLEDSVSQIEKDSARILVRNALRSVDFYGSEKMVRINQLPLGLEDLKFVIPHGVDVILIPKCESANEVKTVDDEIKMLRAEFNFRNEVYLMPIIESAKGIMEAFEIASASENICALTIGLEDYTADLGTQRTNDGRESFFARSLIVNAAKAAGIQAIDTVFSDVNDMNGLYESVIEAKSLGFEGKGCIHPRQIEVIHKAFAPSEKEIEKAKKIILAFDEAKKNGLAVVSLGSKMIDAPVVKRAFNTIKLAILNNLLDENWKEK
jgi:citrate lyase subunit beta/citryl-CoA lyase